MKRPAFQFYVDAWLSDSALRRCTHAERGVWIDVLCFLHQGDQYGVLRWPLSEIAQAVGCKLPVLQGLVARQVLRGTDRGECEPFIYTPRSGRKEGAPVTLVAAEAGPIWYSRRMVRDEYVRTIRGESGRFGETPKAAPKPPKGDGPPASTPSPATQEQKQEPPLPPTGGKPSRSKPLTSLPAFLDDCRRRGVVAIPPDAAVFSYADKIGLPPEFLDLAWAEFESRHTGNGKRYRDWPAAFLNAVKGNWFKLWWVQEGEYRLTTPGVQAQRAASARAAA